jgi:predicted AlkP superfamily phosphohydrolase/phosphomutase
VAIGLDSADPILLERWIDAGELPTLARLRDTGAYGRISGPGYYRAELAWTTFLTGCEPERTGYWSPLSFDPRTYSVNDIGAYDFREYSPFYALGEGTRVCAFDVPQAVLVDGVDGLQVVAWGAHSPQAPSGSIPADLFAELTSIHGRHPALNRDHAAHWNPVAVAWLRRALQVGIERRAAICVDLLRRERWDLFLTVFSEPHTAGHYFWHLGEEHPLGREEGGNELLDLFRRIDAALGSIVAAAPRDARIVVYSLHGMESNSMDLPSMVFLPELLYRFAFPDHVGLAPGEPGTEPPPPIRRPRSLGWPGDVWRRKASGPPALRMARRWLPLRLAGLADRWLGGTEGPGFLYDYGSIFYQPGMWYSRHWPAMPAFALPSFSEGYIRVNLAGREAHGTVSPDEYDGLLTALERHVRALVDARTGEPLASDVVRTRADPLDPNPRLPDADLVVLWHARPVDVVDSPTFGRIGPIPFGRTGSHVSRGFLLASGPGITPGSHSAEGRVVAVAPTLLELLGASVPATRFQGEALLAAQATSR